MSIKNRKIFDMGRDLTLDPINSDSFRDVWERNRTEIENFFSIPINYGNGSWAWEDSNTGEMIYGSLNREKLREIVREALTEEFRELNLPKLIEEKKVEPAANLPYGNLNKRKLKYRKNAHSRTSQKETKKG